MPPANPSTLSSAFNTAPDRSGSTAAGVTFTNGRLYVFGYEYDAGTQTALDTGFTFLHGAGTDRTGSWSCITQVFGGTARVLAAYQYQAATTETVDFCFKHGGSTPNSNAFSLNEIASGFNTGTPIAQSSRTSGTGISGISGEFPSAPAATSLLMAYVGSRAASGAISPRPGYTELTEGLGTGTTGDSGGLEVQYLQASDKTYGASVSGTRTFFAIGIEIATAAAAGDVVDTSFYRQTSQGAFFQ